MNTFLQQLMTLLQVLQPAPGTLPQAVDDLLSAFAASLILQNPANATLPPGVVVDPRIVAAVHAGADRAGALKAAGLGLRILHESLPLGTTVANQPEHRSAFYGPFVEASGRLSRFVSIETPTFLNVNARGFAGPAVGELLLLIPAASTPVAADLRSWQLPAGTTWIESKFVLAGATGFSGVRITGGSLAFSQAVVQHGGLLVTPGTVFTLTLTLEQPPAPAGGASDADAVTLVLPTQLIVRSNAAPTLVGNGSLSGFGSDLTFTPGGAPFLDGNHVSLPLQVSEAAWTIAGNSSRVTQFAGSVAPANARFALPVSSTAPTQLGEAAHGGAIAFSLGDGLTSTLVAQSGDVSRWFATTVTVSAAHVEVISLQPVCGASYDLALWNACLTKLRFAGKPVLSLVYRSERSGFDTVAVVGGSCSNLWDLPRRADDEPFTFAGVPSVFGFVASTAAFVVALLATSAADASVQGFVLENLYVLVRPPRQLALIAAFDTGPVLPAGTAVLAFDVLSALPMLPDPYAANLALPRVAADTPVALRTVLQWTDGATPALTANLDAAVPFPQPTVNVLDDNDESLVFGAFVRHLDSQMATLYLLDLSSREHLFGVAMEPLSANPPVLIDNRLSVELGRVRLLMQPQVQWEPVRVVANPDVLVADGFGHSRYDGGPTLVGANSVTLVPVLPGVVSEEIVTAIQGSSAAAALFSLPFGLRAMASLDLVNRGPNHETLPAATATSLNEPGFGDLTSARQIRLVAGGAGVKPGDPSRIMPGIMRQLANFQPQPSGLTSVLPNVLRDALNSAFGNAVPLHRVDLSGYGLSTFSEWSQDVEGAGFSKVEFRAMNGRTAYEVIQFRSILYECGARVVRTVILERHNSGRVFRTDTGWVAIDAGEFKRPDAFQKGAVQSFQNIRRIRVTGPAITLTGSASVVEPVVFDADAAIDGAAQPLTPMYDRPGYIQIKPVNTPAPAPAVLKAQQVQLLQLLYAQFHAIASPVNASVRVGATLEAQITSIVSDLALDDGGGVGFAVAVVGAPKLPRAGQWSVVCINPATHETTPTDPGRGVPLVRNGADAFFRLREPSDTRRTLPLTDYALLMATDTSRALFQRPSITISNDIALPGTIHFDVPPVLADPYSLVQSTGAFPRPNFSLLLDRVPFFNVTPDDLWSIDNPVFNAVKPLADFMDGGGWGLNRDYDPGPITLAIDSGVAKAFDLAIPPSILKLQLPSPLDEVINIRNTYKAAADEISKLADPEVIFKGALQQLTSLLDALASITGLPFHFDVSVTAGTGPSPSFLVHMHLLFRIGDGPDGRVEVGLGKFYGQFQVDGQLQASLTGVEDAALSINFQGDIQQGILPPLLYAGGLIRFSVALDADGPTIQLTLGIVISIGGDFIPGLLAVEATISYGYSLIPETLAPGIFLGLEARAKLLGGIIGFSFSVEASASVKRKADPLLVTVTAKLRIAATVQIAIFIEEDVDFETQFSQDIPLIAFALVGGALPVLLAEAPL